MDKKTVTLALMLAAAAPAAHAILVTASTTSAASFRTCIAGTSGCDQIVTGPPAASFNDGLPGATSAHVAGSVPGYGSAQASVSLSGTIGAPFFSAMATGMPSTRTNTTSFALQSYTYTGAGPATRTFGGTLTYSQTSTGTYAPDIGDGVVAGLDIFTLRVPAVEAGTTAGDNLVALASLSTLPGYTSLGSQSFEDTASAFNGLAHLAVTTTLQPGEVVWVLALLQTPATSGGTTDASHTFVTGWDDPSGLTPAVAVSAVPEPDTQALIGLGLLALVARRGKRARPRAGRGR